MLGPSIYKDISTKLNGKPNTKQKEKHNKKSMKLIRTANATKRNKTLRKKHQVRQNLSLIHI